MLHGRQTFLAFASAAFASTADACPSAASDPLWMSAACEMLAGRPSEMAMKIARVEEVFADAPTEVKALLITASAAGGMLFNQNASVDEILGLPINFVSTGEVVGIMESRDFMEDFEAYDHFLSSTRSRGTVDIGEFLNLLSILADERGTRLLFLKGQIDYAAALAVTPEDYCRWSDVRLEEFDLIGSIDLVDARGGVGAVEWSTTPRKCAGSGT